MILEFVEEPNSYIYLNIDMLNRYKHEADVCLINAKRELTKQLVDYKIFNQLQKINNSFYCILNGLYKQKYYNGFQLISDKTKLEKNINQFLRNVVSELPEDKYSLIEDNLKTLKLIITKLLKIVDEMLRGNGVE